MKNQKMFVIKKYIMAKSAIDALKKSKGHPADEVWIDDDWKKGQAQQLASAMGFEASADIE